MRCAPPSPISHALIAALVATLPHAPAAAQANGWVERSDANARILLEQFGELNPELAGRFGVDGLDERILELSPGRYERQLERGRSDHARLEARLAAETDPLVRLDLEILLEASAQSLESLELERGLLLPYFDAVETIFGGVRALLDDQVPEARRPAALIRLRKYAGLEPDRDAFLVLAARQIRKRLPNPKLLGPTVAELDKHVSNHATYLEGIARLFEKYGIQGWRGPLAALERQVTEYEAFLESEVRPRAREDFRLPPELYAFALRQFGVEMDPEELASRARVAFMEIRNEMKALAPLVAEQRGLTSSDYRDVIRALKRDQLVGEAILPHYEERLAQIEAIIEREEIVTLPERPARIRIASQAEAASIPAPNMQPPRLIGNTGEVGEFVLPLNLPTRSEAGEEESAAVDDLTFEAASWTLTAHEARPGHELQYASIVENGVSMARALFAFNSVNVEGWALYAESEMKPFLPLDGQLIALQHRLLRAARAFLDPELQLGRLEPEQALAFLMEEVVISEAAARSEVDRYTFRAPGQATSYFYGYTRWLELRSEVELRLRDRFDQRRFHDFVLAQGLLPPDQLADAVRAEFLKPASSGGR